MSLIRQNQRLIEASPYRIGLDQRRVHVGAGDLAAGRDGVIVDPAPGRESRMSVLVTFDVTREGHGKHRQLIMQIVEPNSDDLIRLVDERPEVAILTQTFLLKELDGDVTHHLGREIDLRAQNARRVQHTDEMVDWSKQEQLLLV